MFSFRYRALYAALCTVVALLFVVTVPAVNAGATTTTPVASPVSVGQGQVCATVASGADECYGIDTNGQLGYFYGNLASTPSDAGSINNASATSAGANSTCAVLFTGGVDCWGNDQYGQLGNGETEQYSVSPVPVIGISTATTVSMGTNFACATLASGSVECWGNNNSGDLGNGGTSQETSPVLVTGISDAVQVSAGYDFACALLSTGSIDCWGDNSNDALGTSTDSNSTLDFLYSVGSITNATEVTAGQDGVCALLSTGSIDCWGANTDGDLGDGSTMASLAPMSVSGITAATSVSMGTDFACAIVSGSADCWGDGTSGQLGNGNNVDSDTPVQVSSLTGVTAVSAGLTACAVATGAAVSCWGTNSWDELGTYGGGSSDIPVLISGLHAVTPEPTYTVSFASDGGSSESSLNYAVDGSSLTLPTPTYTGYTFNGWYTEITGGTLVSSPYAPSSSTTLYAQWTPDVYTVGFNAEGGAIETSLNYTVGGTALTLPVTSETGYGFNGWFTAPSGGTLVSSPYAPSSSTTLYAQWTPNVYTVSLDADGGSVTPTSEPFTVGNAGVTLPRPTRADFNFEGWFATLSGGTAIASPYTPTASTTLYAHWAPITYIVTLNPGDGTVTPSEEAYFAGGAPLALPTPTYTGYAFLGWYTSSTGGSLEGSTYTPTSATTLYAQWKPDAYTVSFDATGGQVNPANSTFTIGGNPVTLATPTRAGYRFAGWYSAVTGGSLESSPYTPTSSLTLYAKWKVDAPGKPSAVTISRSGNTVNLRWASVDNASHYVCTLFRGSSSRDAASSTTTANHCSFAVPAVRTAYRVRVVATNAAGASSASVADLAR